MARLNAKRAKELRAASQYKNQTATPGALKFPGVFGMMQFPMFETRRTMKRSSAIVDGRWCVVETPVEVVQGVRSFNGRINAVPVLKKETFKRHDGTEYTHMVPQNYPVPVTKPAKYDSECGKGVYRYLKKLNRSGLLCAVGASEVANA